MMGVRIFRNFPARGKKGLTEKTFQKFEKAMVMELETVAFFYRSFYVEIKNIGTTSLL